MKNNKVLLSVLVALGGILICLTFAGVFLNEPIMIIVSAVLFVIDAIVWTVLLAVGLARKFDRKNDAGKDKATLDKESKEQVNTSYSYENVIGHAKRQINNFSDAWKNAPKGVGASAKIIVPAALFLVCSALFVYFLKTEQKIFAFISLGCAVAIIAAVILTLIITDKINKSKIKVFLARTDPVTLSEYALDAVVEFCMVYSESTVNGSRAVFSRIRIVNTIYKATVLVNDVRMVCYATTYRNKGDKVKVVPVPGSKLVIILDDPQTDDND